MLKLLLDEESGYSQIKQLKKDSRERRLGRMDTICEGTIHQRDSTTETYERSKRDI